MSDRMLSALGGISEQYLTECETAWDAKALPTPPKRRGSGVFASLGYVAMVAAVLAIFIVAPGLLERKPTGAAVGSLEIMDGVLAPSEDLLNQIATEFVEFFEKDMGEEEAAAVLKESLGVDDGVWVARYYGTYNGAVVFLLGDLSKDPIPEDRIIFGSVIRYENQMNHITVWYDGTFMALNMAYNEGLLTKEDIARIVAFHNAKTNEALGEKVPKPSSTLCHRIEADYAGYRDATEKHYVQHYYGMYNEAGVVMMTMPAFQVHCTEEVAGFTFYYADMNFIQVWKDGAFFSLKEAYEQGVLSKDDIGKLSDIHNMGKYWNRYSSKEPTTEPVDTSDSSAFDPSEEWIEALIQKEAPEEKVKRRYSMFSIDKPKEFTYDPSVYILEYNVSANYWKEIDSFDYQGLTRGLSGAIPSVYIPLFAEITNLNGKSSERVIGYVKLYYDGFSQGYEFLISLCNTSDDDFKNKITCSFIEEVFDYSEQSRITQQEVFLLRHSTSLTDGQETVAVLHSEAETVIFDMSNSAHIDVEGDQYLPKAYSIEEFRALRLDAEKLYDDGRIA